MRGNQLKKMTDASLMLLTLADSFGAATTQIAPADESGGMLGFVGICADPELAPRFKAAWERMEAELETEGL